MRRESARRRCSPISLPAVVVADANVLLSALIGGRAGLVLSDPRGPRCLASEAVRREVGEYLPSLVERRGLDADLVLGAFRLLPVEWIAEDGYAEHGAEARRRMAARDPDDWPVVALALSRATPIWSQNRDLEVAGIAVFSTGRLLDLLRDAEGGPEAGRS